MDEGKRTARTGRPTIYGENLPEQAGRNVARAEQLERKALQPEQTDRAADQGLKEDYGIEMPGQKKASSRRVQMPGRQRTGVPNEGERIRTGERDRVKKQKILFFILGVLIALLVLAIVYEIVLGNGTKDPGSSRMAQTVTEEVGYCLRQPQTLAV